MANFLNNADFHFQISAPSWVIPGTIAENCRFLAGKVDEVALLFLKLNPASPIRTLICHKSCLIPGWLFTSIIRLICLGKEEGAGWLK